MLHPNQHHHPHQEKDLCVGTTWCSTSRTQQHNQPQNVQSEQKDVAILSVHAVQGGTSYLINSSIES
jgi:hypothetical protein